MTSNEDDFKRFFFFYLLCHEKIVRKLYEFLDTNYGYVPKFIASVENV